MDVPATGVAAGVVVVAGAAPVGMVAAVAALAVVAVDVAALVGMVADVAVAVATFATATAEFDSTPKGRGKSMLLALLLQRLLIVAEGIDGVANHAELAAAHTNHEVPAAAAAALLAAAAVIAAAVVVVAVVAVSMLCQLLLRWLLLFLRMMLLMVLLVAAAYALCRASKHKHCVEALRNLAVGQHYHSSQSAAECQPMPGVAFGYNPGYPFQHRSLP